MLVKFLGFLAAAAGFAFAASAQAPVIATEAEHALIMDHESGVVLFSKAGDIPMIPASMTKIMTAYIVFDRLERGEITLEDKFTVSEKAWREGGWASGGSTMGLGVGDEPTVDELLRGVIVLSGNDACIVLAEGLSGSEANFALEMTELGKELGLTTATFENSTGLDGPDHRISAKDLATLAKLTIEKFPQFYDYYADETYEWRGISQPNRNPLLGRMDGVDGLKTGHLSVSGYGLVASAERDGVRRIIVLNGLPSESARANEAERLMRMAFTSFETKTISPKDIELPPVNVALGSKRSVAVSLAEPVRITGHKRALEDATVELVYNGPIRAPVKAGDKVGELVVQADGVPTATADVIAEEASSRLGFFGKAIEGLSVKLGGGASD